MSNAYDDAAYNKGTQSARTLGNLGGSLWAGTTGGSANAYTLTVGGLDAYVAGHCFLCRFNIVNTTASTININGLGTKAINVAGAAAASGDLAVAKTFLLCYNGTAYDVI